VKLIRTIRLDPSDTFVFERAADPGEWAVSGAFAFWNADIEALEGKVRSAFRGAFLGVESLGWSTLVQIVEAGPADRTAVVERMAQQLVDQFGAPDLVTARVAAQDEVAFAQSLCNHAAGTLIAVHRSFDNGEVREAFRTLHPRGDRKQTRAFSFLEVEGEDEPDDAVDLVAMATSRKEPP
jgi:hypothetical protein